MKAEHGLLKKNILLFFLTYFIRKNKIRISCLNDNKKNPLSFFSKILKFGIRKIENKRNVFWGRIHTKTKKKF